MAPIPASVRIARLLVMVPWLARRGRTTVPEVAQAFHITVEQARQDLGFASLLGVPPYTPECYAVDVVLEGDDVEVFGRPYLKRPPKLTAAEGLTLLAAGKALLEVPGAEVAGPLATALAKLERVLGSLDAVIVDLQHPPLLAAVRAAAEEGRRLRITYWTAWRDEVGERDIDPLAVFQKGGRWYVEADCRRSGELRRFRVDRIHELADTGERFERRAAAVPEDVFTPGPGERRVVLDLPADARWVVEAYPNEHEERDGRLRVVLHVVGETWLERLLLRVGPDAAVVEPADLRDLGARAAARLLARY